MSLTVFLYFRGVEGGLSREKWTQLKGRKSYKDTTITGRPVECTKREFAE